MTLDDSLRVKVQAHVSGEVARRLVARADVERRSVSAMAALLIEAGLGGGDTSAAEGNAAAGAVGSSGVVSPPSSPALSERGSGDDGSDSGTPDVRQRGTAVPFPPPRSESARVNAPSGFKPDPKPGKR